MACCLTEIFQVASHPAGTDSVVSLPDHSVPVACCLTGTFQAVFQSAETHPAFSLTRHSDRLPCLRISVFRAAPRSVVIGSAGFVASLRSDLTKDSILIWNLNSKSLDSGSYIAQASVEPPESAWMLVQLVIPPSWELEWPLAIVGELASLHWLLA